MTPPILCKKMADHIVMTRHTLVTSKTVTCEHICPKIENQLSVLLQMVPGTSEEKIEQYRPRYLGVCLNAVETVLSTVGSASDL